MRVSFSVSIEGETFSQSVEVDLLAKAVVGDLISQVSSRSGKRLAVFVFRRQLGRLDLAISMHVKLLNTEGQTETVWHVIVDLQGNVLHLHSQ
jgi:hypothetical protein